MRKLVTVFFVFALVANACNRQPELFVPKPPFAHLDPAFKEIIVNPAKDSTYDLSNGSRIKILAGSLLDDKGTLISEPVTLKFRQFDDALGIYLAGMPMSFNNIQDNGALETAGMFEIRASYNGADVAIDPEKPLKVIVGSNFPDTKQGFFILDKTGNWQLLDIPESRTNPEVDTLKNSVKKLQTVFSVPLTPDYFVFSYGRMADISLNDADWPPFFNSNKEEMTAKMKMYGVSSLEADFQNPTVKYKGNKYDISEVLWKNISDASIPGWVRKSKQMGDRNPKTKNVDFNYSCDAKPLGDDLYEFTIVQKSPVEKFSLRAQLVTHIRYLFKYSLSEWEKRKASTEQEISEIEARLRATRITEYTVSIYQMGVYNCDKPLYFRKERPVVTFSLNGTLVPNNEIANASAFNNTLSSTTQAAGDDKQWELSIFNGVNRIVMSTNEGELGILTSDDFNAMKIDSLLNTTNPKIHFNLRKITVPVSEEEFRKILE